MKPVHKFFLISIFSVFFLSVSMNVHADTYQVLSLRVEKLPGDCQTTLFVTIKNNSGQTSDSGLFVYAAQFREIQNNKKVSSGIGAVRLDNLPAGQLREVSYDFFRERRKTEASFRFKVGANTLAYSEKSLPPVTEGFSAQFSNLNLDTANNKLTGSITNQGSVAIPRPAIQLFIASTDTPNDFQPGGGGIVSQCLPPGASTDFSKSIQQTGSASVIKIALLADGINLDEKILGGSLKVKKVIPGIKPVPQKQIKPSRKSDVKRRTK